MRCIAALPSRSPASRSPMSLSPLSCPVCQFSYHPDDATDGICPRCLLLGGVGDAVTDDPQPAADGQQPPAVAELKLLQGAFFKKVTPQLS